MTVYDSHKGDLRLSTHDDGTVYIEHADPYILISAELLDLIAAGDWPVATYDGRILRISARNRTVVYQVGPPIPGDRDKFCPADAVVEEWRDTSGRPEGMSASPDNQEMP